MCRFSLLPRVRPWMGGSVAWSQRIAGDISWWGLKNPGIKTYEKDIRKRHTKKTYEKTIRKNHTKKPYEKRHNQMTQHHKLNQKINI